MTTFRFGTTPCRASPTFATDRPSSLSLVAVPTDPVRLTKISMRVLSYSDFSVTHPGYYLFLAHQLVKETMAVVGSVSNLSAVAGGDVKIL